MPLCFLRTSLARTAIPKYFERQLSEKIAEILNKPPEVSIFFLTLFLSLSFYDVLFFFSFYSYPIKPKPNIWY